MPPFRARGVIEVMLSMKRESSKTVSLAVMSRPTEMMCLPSTSYAVPSTQSLWAPWKKICSPVLASMARTVLSPQPKAMALPSGDQLAP